MSNSITGTRLFTTAHAGLTGGAAGNSESIAFDAARNLLFVMGANGVDALNASTGALAFSISKAQLATAAGINVATIGNGNSVAVSGNNLAMTFDNATAGTAGFAAVYTINAQGTAATFRANATVGAVPDMITFTPDGSRAVVAIEGEPTQGYTTDPAGGLTILNTATWTPTFVGFGALDAQAAALRAAGVKLSNAIPGSAQANQALPSLDLEPEYVAISPDGNTAYVTIQENNAIGVFNLQTNAWTAVLPLGLANHNIAGNGIDTSDRDGGAIIRQVPISGMYQPDAIALFQQGGRTFLVTANEGDAREYGGTNNVFNEAARISEIVPATGSTPPAGMPALDAALLSAIQSRRGDADLGRLDVTRWAGDTDGDGDLDRLQAFGSRSFTIWEVGGTPTAPTLTQTFDSRQLLDQIVASQLPALYDDARADNKGVEPEHITLGTVNGVVHAFVGLERANANLVFRVDGPTSVSYVGQLNNATSLTAGDVAPETSAFIPASGATPARLAVANEVSGTTTVYSVAPTTGTYTLQILHGSDFEAGLLATGRARQFAAIVDRLEDALPNSITVSGGDNFIPGPFGAAGTDPAVASALRSFYARQLGQTDLPNLFGSTASPTIPFFAADVAILNAIGIQASALGNHDFDLGTNPLNAVVDFTSNTTGATPAARVTGVGAQFPYLSANLDFSADANIRAIVTQTLREASTYATTAADIASNQTVANEAADAQIAPWTTIVEGGQTIGILGVTTQILAAISSPGATRVLDPAGDGGRDNMAELAQILQPLVDQMTAQGINKIVLLSHLQQYQNELALAPLMRGVDVIISAGSHTVFADSQDTLRPGDRATEGYPVYRTGADGNPVAIVSTSGEYSYVGRLVVTFDANGVLIADPDGTGPLGVGGVNPTQSGAFATTDATVASLWGAENPYAAGTRGGEVQAITNAVQSVITTKDGALFGRTGTFLEGRRGEVRTEETNLGNLTADANLFVARQVDAGVLVSHKNGGGIRAEIGAIVGQPVPRELPPLSNAAANKPGGAVSQLDIENSLRFNNALSIVSVTAQNLERILEHAVAGTAPGATPGQFGQWGGLAFTYDASRTAQVVNATTGAVTTEGLRIVSAAILNEDGTVRDALVQNGALVGDPSRVIKMVTLNFLADGGDSYPFPAYTIPGSRVDLSNNPALPQGLATFATRGTEQDALAEFGAAFHGTGARAYNTPDTTPTGDLRVMSLQARTDAVFQTPLNGTAGNDVLTGAAGSDLIQAAAGNDTINISLGRDTVYGGLGFDTVFTNLGRGEGGFIRAADGAIQGWAFSPTGTQGGVTHFREIERVSFVDGTIEYAGGSLAHQVNAVYRGVLSRDADPVAMGRLVELLGAGRVSVADMVRGVTGSAEASAVTGALSNTAFVTKLYADILGRTGSAAEISLHVGFLNSNAPNARATVVQGFVTSAELVLDATGMAKRGLLVADNRAGFVDFAFEELLGRNVDVSGFNAFLTAMRQGATERDVTRSIASSAEFNGIYGSFGNAAFVEQMYQNVLGRASDATGATNWTNALNSGALSRGDVAHGFLTSAEALPQFNQNLILGADIL